MKGILIDPFARTVTQVDVLEGIYGIYKLIQARPFDCVRIDERNAIYVDDEGLYRDDQRFFQFRSYHQPLAGRGLILGNNREGETVSCTLTLDDVKGRVTFPAVALAGFNEIPEGTTDNRYGIEMPVIGSTPVFGPDEEAVICSIINKCGTGEHPMATLNNLSGFNVGYIAECVNKAAPDLTPYAREKALSYMLKAREKNDKNINSIVEQIYEELNKE